MKKIVLFSYFLLIFLNIQSQNKLGSSDDAARISLAAYIPPQIEGLTPAAESNLLNKLNQIASKNGMGASVFNNRFIITANVVVQTKDITPTAPPMHAYTLDITLYVGDGIDGTMFSNTTVSLKGVGETETKAYFNALKNLKVDDPKYQNLIETGKKRIIEYYNAQCDFILKDAKTLAGTKNYDAAIYRLASVPDVCKECYEKCLDKITEVYKAKIENECQQNISQAKTLIAQDNYNDAASMLSAVTPDMQCYTQAASVIKEINDHKCAVSLGEAKGYWVSHDVSATSMALSAIPSDSKCYADALVLANEVEKYVKETEKREFEVMKQQMKNEQDEKMANIKAARDIGVAYGNNQPKTITTYNISGWW